MRNDMGLFISGLAAGLIVGFFTGAKLVDTIGSNNTETHEEIMQHNCAEYDSRTGYFKWKDEE